MSRHQSITQKAHVTRHRVADIHADIPTEEAGPGAIAEVPNDCTGEVKAVHCRDGAHCFWSLSKAILRNGSLH